MRDMSHAYILRALFLGTQFSCLWCFTRVVGTPRAWLALHARGWHSTRVVGTARAWLALHARGWHYTRVVDTPRAWLALHVRGWHLTLGFGLPL